MKNNPDFELIPHTADIKLRVYGKDLKELFKHAVIGMFQSIGPQSTECHREKERLVCPQLPITHRITLNSFNIRSLLVNFLSEALYLSDTHNEAYLDAQINSLSETFIDATLYGIKVEGFEVVEIKAVTHHDLVIEKINDHWKVDIVFDI